MEPAILPAILREAAARIPVLLLGSAVKGSLVFAAVAAVSLAVRKAHPRLQSLLWLFAASAYLLVLTAQVGMRPLPVEVANPFSDTGLHGAFSVFLDPAGGVAAAQVAGEPGGTITRASTGQRAVPLTALTLAWAAGAVLASFRGFLGRIALARLTRRALPPAAGRLPCLLAELRLQQGVRRPVSLLVSARCPVPFTWRVRRPLIMLPTEVSCWSRERVRAVLLHELCHVAWKDPLTRGMVRALCVVFWFVPFIWIAGALLAAEQEKACDREAVEAGAEARQYASCLLDVARLSARPMIFESVGLAGQRRRVLEDRIRSILKGGRAMKKGVLVLTAVLLVAAGVTVAVGASTRELLTEETAWSRFTGTWENPSYAGSQPYVQKLVIRTELIGEDWLSLDSPQPDGTWIVTPKKFWTDAAGNTWFQFFFRYKEGITASGVPTGTGRALLKVDRSGTTLELTSKAGAEGGEYPEKMDPDASPLHATWYFIYRRKS